MISNAQLLRRLKKLEETGLSIRASERDIDAKRKRAQRQESTRIFIPSCINPQRRERCLADPERFLKEYFSSDYSRPFTKLHRRILEAMVEIARTGGEKAIAAPRGRGKSQIAKGAVCYLIFAGLIRFPVIVSQTTAHSQEFYEDFRRKVQFNEKLCEDFPEICHPVRCLEGAPQRASRQHIDGELTRIEWKVDRLRLANVPEKYRGPIDYGGVRMEYRGLDAAIRGINRDGDRPDYVPIDEPETRESAKSEAQIQDRVNALDKDVAGLAGEDHELGQIMLTTLQNNFCLSAQYTDPERKPSWMGERFGWVEHWPIEWNKNGQEGEGLWHEYMAKRREDQRNGDRYGRNATQFFLDNQQQMELGGELLSDNFKAKVLADGWQTVHSPWQEVFNFICDKSFEAFCTEYQNDPPEEEQIEGTQLTAAKVLSRIAKTGQREAPVGTGYDVIGIDLGKYASHWAHTSWSETGCIGTVTDYGIVETAGLDSGSDATAIEHALVAALEVWAEDVRDTFSPQLVLVDSGNWRDAAYAFCRRMGRPFFPAKGWEQGRRFVMPRERTTQKIPYHECYAAYQPEHDVWLYHMQGEYWKEWLQARFLQQTYRDLERVPGSLALFDPCGDNRRHLSFSQHMVAEEAQLIPKDGKQMQRRWFVRNRNNHYLDAMAMACCAAGVLGVRLMPDEEQRQEKSAPRLKKPTSEIPSNWKLGGKAFLASQR